MSAETAAVLREARALIEDESRWIKGTFSKYNVVGLECFCALGAVADVSHGPDVAERQAKRRDGWQSLARSLSSTTNWQRVADFNDRKTTTHADVLALFDRAIAAEEAQP